MNISDTNYNLDVSKLPAPKKSNKKKIIIIVSVIAGIIIVGAVIGIIFALKGGDKKKKSTVTYIPETDEKTDDNDDNGDKNDDPEDESDDEPILIDISYNQDELRFFNIEKNISSIINEENQREQNTTCYYVCTLGIKNKVEKENINDSYYEGFFAILSQTYYNETTKETTLIKDNIDLINIINKENDNKLLQSLQKSVAERKRLLLSRKEVIEEEERIVDVEEELVKPFLKIEFFKNGTFRNIYRPSNLSQENFNEMKEFLDIIIPEISNGTFKSTEERRKENIKAKIAKLLENKENKVYKIRRRLAEGEQENSEGIEVKDTNSSDYYYLEPDYNESSSLIENEEKLKTNVKKPRIKKMANNETQMNSSKDSEVYSDKTKFRGSNITTNVSTILDSNNTVKEIIYKSHMKLLKQEFLSRTDKEIYDSDNYLEEGQLFSNESEKNVTDPNNTVNETEEENMNTTGVIYNLEDAESIFSNIEAHIKLNCTYYNRELIKDVYDNYLEKYEYENDNNSTLRMLRAFKNIMPIKDINKYELVEINAKQRKLEEEEENKYFYGLKKVSHRKNVFQTDFLGLDIALGLTNTYIPSKGRSSVSLRMDLGDYKLSHDIKSFRTNQPIIIENIQQMSFKLVQMMYLTHENILKLNDLYLQKISEIIKKLLNDDSLGVSSDDKYTKIEDYYALISKNNETFKNQFDYLMSNITKMKEGLHQYTNLNLFNSSQVILENYLRNYFNNITEELNIEIEQIKKTIQEINDEAENNTEIIQTFLLEDVNSIIKQIKKYINEDLEKMITNQMNEAQIIYNSEIKEKIKEINNLNQINILEGIIQNNSIFDNVCSKEEKNYVLSNLTEITNIFLSNVTLSSNILFTMFNNSLQKLNIYNISSSLPDISSISNIIKNNTIEDDINEYFSYLDNIDETINDIVTRNIKNYANILYNETLNINDLFNNITLNISNKMLETGKSIKNYLNEINNEKNKNKKVFHNEYLEDNLYKYYNITNKKSEFILKENSQNFSSFDRDFIYSVLTTIISWGAGVIDYNFDLGNQTLNEAKSFVDDCLSECAENEESIWGSFVNLFRDCDCEYYINIDLIKNLQYMSINSYEAVLNNLNKEEFISVIEKYYYSFEPEFKQLYLLVNRILFNDSDFSYLKYTEETIAFNFTLVGEYIINNSLVYLERYGTNKSNQFLKTLNEFVNKKEGTVSNKRYDIKIDTGIFSSSRYTCSHRYNFLYIKDSNSYIINHLKDNKKNISENYLQKLKEYNDFYNTYYQNLINGMQSISSDDNYKINLYFMLENYSSEIIHYLEYLTNESFVENLFHEFENILINNSLPNQTEYLSEIIDNFTSKYSNTSYITGNEEIQFLKEKIGFMKFINYTKDISISNYINYIEYLLPNLIDIIYDLNKNIFNYIISKENENEIIKNKSNEIETMIKDYKSKVKHFYNISSNFIYENNMKNIDNSLIIERILFPFSIKNENDDIITKYMKEIKINREIDRITKILQENKLAMEINNNLFFSIDKKNIESFYHKIKLNITKESEKIYDDYIKPQTNEILKEYSLEMFKQIEKYNNDTNDTNEILEKINDLFPKVDGNISSEIENDLNILYKDLFNLIGKLISLNQGENEINLENETEIYYNEIIKYLNLTKVEENNNIKYNTSEDDFFKDIALNIHKRIKEKNIYAYQSYFNKIFDKYENFKNETYFNSLLSDLYEEYKKEDLFNSLTYIYKNIINNTFDLPDLNKSKISLEEIKTICIKSYENNFNEFKNNFAYENNNKIQNDELIKLIEEKIESILSKIKIVITKSYNETLYLNYDGYYLKRHIINILESQIDLNNSVNKQTSQYIENNIVKMDYVKKIKEKLYSPKIKDILIENYKNSLEDYYSKYYKHEINLKMIILNNYYYSSMINFSEQFINNQLYYIKLLLFKNNNFGNSTLQKIKKLEEILINIINNQIIHNNNIYSNISFLNNKDILLKEFMNNIFDDKFMKIILPNDLKNTFYYNDTIYELLENYTTQLIQEESLKDLNNFFSRGFYNLSEDNDIYKKINSSLQIISRISPIQINKNNTNLSSLLMKLANEYNKLQIKQEIILDKGLFNSMTKEIKEYYKENILEEIIKIYSNFTRHFNLRFHDIIENEINNFKGISGSYDSLSKIAEEIINVSKNYTNECLNEIENYYDKLQIYGMIDGLIYIPIEREEQFRPLWDFSPSKNALRNLEEKNKKRKKIDFTKIIEFYNKQDKTYKKQILSKMEEIMNKTTSSRNLEEYNNNKLFNSTCDPLSFNNISDMISNLIDDITNFQNELNNDYYFTLFRSKYESLKLNSDNNHKLVEINTHILKDELSEFSFFNTENYDYLYNLSNFIKYNSSEATLLKKELFIIYSIENVKLYVKFKETLIATISSTYNFYNNLINVQIKTITTEDNKKYIDYKNNINKATIFDYITKNKIFIYSKEVLKNKLIPFIEEVIYTVGCIIDEVLSNLKYSEEIKKDLNYDLDDDENNKRKNGKKDDDKPIGDLILGYQLDNKNLGVYKCYSIDVISLIMEAITGDKNADYTIKFPCAAFPPLQLRLSPILNFDICIMLGYQYLDENNYPVSKLSIDFSTEAKLGIRVEGGIYLDAILIGASLAVGVEGTIFKGKIGINLSFDFNEGLLYLNIYLNNYGLSFEFYIRFSIQILWWEKTKKISYELDLLPLSVILFDDYFYLFEKKQPELF